MKDLITDLSDLAPQHRLFQNLQSYNRSHSRSSQLQIVLEKFWIYHGFPPSNNSQLEFSNKKKKKIYHRVPNAICEIRLLAKRNGAAIAWQHRKSMTSPLRAEQQAAPAEHRVIHFPSCQQSCSEHADSKASAAPAGHTQPLPINPHLTRRVWQRATQFHMYIQKRKECGDGSLLGELLGTRVSGYKVGSKNTTDLSSSQSSWVDKGFNWTMPT